MILDEPEPMGDAPLPYLIWRDRAEPLDARFISGIAALVTDGSNESLSNAPAWLRRHQTDRGSYTLALQQPTGQAESPVGENAG